MEFDVARWFARSAVTGCVLTFATVVPWFVPPIGAPDLRPMRLAADPTRPFGGSPADRWRDGELGLVTPEPRAVAGFTVEEVRLAYWHVRQVLSAANVDARAVFDRDASTLARLLPGQKPRPHWTTSFAPGTAPGAGFPKVEGVVTARAVRPGALRVNARHLFVYAVRQQGGRPEIKRVVVARWTTLLIHRTGPAVGVRLETTGRTALGASCTATGLRPNFGLLPARGPSTSYDATRPPSGPCRPDTAT